jgi:hypothetical protein
METYRVMIKQRLKPPIRTFPSFSKIISIALYRLYKHYKSTDLDEVFRLSDRILTLFEGKITGEFTAGHFNKAEIGYRMTAGGRGDVHDEEKNR